jgi:putative DNA primase/helicase
MFAFSAPVMGSGKSLAASLVSIIATGRQPAVMSQGRNPEEDRKRLFAAFLAGDAIIQIDNCELPIEGDTICSAITEGAIRDRVLGRSELVSVSSNATMMATGNNLVLKGDMSTRALVCRIEPCEEKPEGREFNWDARAEALAKRPEYVAAALTIVMAFQAAGSPSVDAKTFGRFEQWQRFVQFPMIWAGSADPAKSRDLIEGNDPEREALTRLFHLWREVFGNAAVRVNDFARLPDLRLAPPKQADARELFDLVCELTGTGGRDLVDPKRLGNYLSKREGRQSGSLRLVKGYDAKSKVATWRLVDRKD